MDALGRELPPYEHGAGEFMYPDDRVLQVRLFEGPAAPVGQALERHLLDGLRVGETRAVAELGCGVDAVGIRPAGVEADLVGAVQVVAIAAVRAPFGADGEGIRVA